MNNLINIDINAGLTMSSLEIAELTGKRHDHVLRDIENMLDELKKDDPSFRAIYKANNNQEYRCFNLPKRETLILVSGYSLAARARIIDHWDDELREIIESLNNFEVPDDIPDIYVYAIKEVDTGNIKLGISRNPLKRLKQLQTGNSSKLELVGYKKAVNGYKDEKAIHNDNVDKHIIGEWFSNDVVFS